MSKLGQHYIFPFHTPLCSYAENFISLGIITTKIILKVIPVLKGGRYALAATGRRMLLLDLYIYIYIYIVLYVYIH